MAKLRKQHIIASNEVTPQIGSSQFVCVIVRRDGIRRHEVMNAALVKVSCSWMFMPWPSVYMMKSGQGRAGEKV